MDARVSLPGVSREARCSWRDRWLAFRNSRIADPAFQRWAAGFLPTRRIARRNTRALFDLCAGFVYSQVLFACVKLDLFRHLADGPLTAAQVGARLDLPEEGALRLLKAAASLELTTRRADGRFALADLGAALIGNPAVAAMIAHHALLYADLADPVALLREGGGGGRLAAFWRYGDRGRSGEADDASVAAYSGLMAASQAFIAQDVLDACPLGDRTCLMDVGGGQGAFLTAVARRHPHVRLMLFDLPPVVRRAEGAFAAYGLDSRIVCHRGSFHTDALPRGADAITLVRVLHDHDDHDALALLRAVREALPPNGIVIIAEPMAGTKGAEPIGDAYFGFYLLAMGSGRARSADEYRAMLSRAGFAETVERATCRPLLTRLLIAKRGTQV